MLDVRARVGVPVRRQVDVVVDDGQQRAGPFGERFPHRVRAGEVQPHGAVAVEDEVSRNHDRQVPVGAGRDQLPEVPPGEPGMPFVVGRGIPRM